MGRVTGGNYAGGEERWVDGHLMKHLSATAMTFDMGDEAVQSRIRARPPKRELLNNQATADVIDRGTVLLSTKNIPVPIVRGRFGFGLVPPKN